MSPSEQTSERALASASFPLRCEEPANIPFFISTTSAILEDRPHRPLSRVSRPPPPLLVLRRSNCMRSCFFFFFDPLPRPPLDGALLLGAPLNELNSTFQTNARDFHLTHNAILGRS